MIEKAKLSDLDDLVALFNAYRVFYKKDPDTDSAKAFLRARLEKDESVIFLAREGIKAVGFTQLYPLWSSTRMKRLWLLNDLFVDPDHRGTGLSKNLIEAAKDLCRQTNACGMFLQTTLDNVVGNKLYPSTGFVLDDKHNYYEWATD